MYLCWSCRVNLKLITLGSPVLDTSPRTSRERRASLCFGKNISSCFCGLGSNHYQSRVVEYLCSCVLKGFGVNRVDLLLPFGLKLNCSAILYPKLLPAGEHHLGWRILRTSLITGWPRHLPGVRSMPLTKRGWTARRAGSPKTPQTNTCSSTSVDNISCALSRHREMGTSA